METVPRALSRALVALAAAFLSAVPAAALQSEESALPDQVFARDRRGRVQATSGVVRSNTLAEVVLLVRDREQKIPSGDIERIVYGDVPEAFRDGETYFDRGDYTNSASSYQLAASNAVRDVIKAEARLRAGLALLKAGAKQEGAFAEALAELTRFLGESSDNRRVPEARRAQARAKLLTGDAAGAAALYDALFQEVSGLQPTTGYPLILCLEAGLEAAEAYLAAGDSIKAQTVYGGLEATLQRTLQSLGPDDPLRDELQRLQGEVKLKDGWIALASGNFRQAETFFRGEQRGADGESPVVRFGATLGLAEALLGQKQYRVAQMEFATVSALDHTNRDRAGRALIGLALCAAELPDTGGKAQSQKWLQEVLEHYGDTPAVLRAQELSR